MKTTLTCRECGFVGESELEFDVSGACDGCLFCPQCSTEIEADTGKKHETGTCCVANLFGPEGFETQSMCPTRGPGDDVELISKWDAERRGDKKRQVSLFE